MASKKARCVRGGGVLSLLFLVYSVWQISYIFFTALYSFALYCFVPPYTALHSIFVLVRNNLHNIS